MSFKTESERREGTPIHTKQQIFNYIKKKYLMKAPRDALVTKFGERLAINISTTPFQSQSMLLL